MGCSSIVLLYNITVLYGEKWTNILQNVPDTANVCIRERVRGTEKKKKERGWRQELASEKRRETES